MHPCVEPTIERLCAAFPATFDRQAPRPLKIGLGAELLALAGAHPALLDVSRIKIRRALAVYTAFPAYRKALAHGGPRYGLDGQPAGEVTPEQQAFAQGRRTKPAAPPIDWQALLIEAIAMAIPGKLDVTLKLYQLARRRGSAPAVAALTGGGLLGRGLDPMADRGCSWSDHALAAEWCGLCPGASPHPGSPSSRAGSRGLGRPREA